jgi:hypothetical protein
MTQQTPATLEHILYAQAVQIASSLSGEKPNLLFNPNMSVEDYLDSHKNMIRKVYKYLLDRKQADLE